MLEELEAVERYSWFATRNPVHKFCQTSSLFEPGSVELSSTGEQRTSQLRTAFAFGRP